MSWDPTWETVFQNHDWGRYPPEELIRFIARRYFSAPERDQVKVLEVGCGTGANIWFLAREGFDAYGIDGSETAIFKAESRMREEGVKAHLQVKDAITLAGVYPAHHFDAVIDVACLQHNKLSAVDAILDQVYLVMKPGGSIYSMMVTSDSYGADLGKEIEPGTFIEVTEGPLHERGLGHFFTLEEVQLLFERFTDVQIEHSARSMGNRTNWYNHWVIEGLKPYEQ